MRYARRTSLSFLLALSLLGFGFDNGCSSTSLASYANRVVESVQDVLPIIKSGSALAAIQHGRELASAFKAKDNALALELTELLINDFARLRIDVQGLPDSRTRTYALALLAAGDVALHFIVDSFPQPTTTDVRKASPVQARQLHTIAVFKAQKHWRCRSSQTGRFEKMEYCVKHPDVSQVETY